MLGSFWYGANRKIEVIKPITEVADRNPHRAPSWRIADSILLQLILLHRLGLVASSDFRLV